MAEVTLWNQMDNDNFQAIVTYIEEQRPQIKKHPELQKVIEDFEVWKDDLSWYQTTVSTQDTLGQAVTWRDKVNNILGQKPDPTIIPGDIMHKIVPKKIVDTTKTSLIPKSFWVGVITVLSAGLAIVIFKKTISLSPAGQVAKALLPKKEAVP